MATNFTTNTPSLKTTVADVRKLTSKVIDAEKIKLQGQDIEDLLGGGEGSTVIKLSNDTRETVTEYDLWGQYVENKNGEIIIHDDLITPKFFALLGNDIVGYSPTYLDTVAKIKDNKAYDSNGNFLSNIQTERLKEGYGIPGIGDYPTSEVGMFQYNTLLAEFSSNLSNLTSAQNMFDAAKNLKVFNSELPELIDSSCMFNQCKLSSFNIPLPKLINGDRMFNICESLTSFNLPLQNLIYSNEMFYSCDLKEFTVDLPNVINADGMFAFNENLKTFKSALPSLIYGGANSWTGMFFRCKLSPKSVLYIVDGINDITKEKELYTSGKKEYVTNTNGVLSADKGFGSDGTYHFYYVYHGKKTATRISSSSVGKITIGIDVTNNSSTIQQQLQAFAEEATFNSWADLKQAFVDKGWIVTWQYGGTNTSITYDTRGERAIPCPIYAQLVQVEDKDHAEYTNEDGTKLYNINWGHDVTNPQDFQQFDSLEDAAASYGVFLKENIITTEGEED